MTSPASSAASTRNRRAMPAPATTTAATPAPAIARFPTFPPRNDLMNSEHFHDYGNQPALRLHLGNPDTTIVLGEVPLHRNIPSSRAGVRIPDLLIAFNIRRAQIIAQKGYAISEQGKPPDFVLEVASDRTASNDETDKLLDYARFGVVEYWLFDPDWGRRYSAGLIGWQLVGEQYQAIPIHQAGPGRYYGWSAVLGLYVCWEQGRLRWYDPASGYLLTHDEERSGRIAERDGRIAERDARIAEQDARIAERDARIAEQDARIAAETQRDAALAEAQNLRDEVARLRAETDQA